MSVDWSYFDRFQIINDRYLPVRGEGSTKASQIVTAVTKLVYKWYNDGDVYDNRYFMDGWCNDLSSYANWLAKYTDAGEILYRISDCTGDSDYEELLKDLADKLLDMEDLEKQETPTEGSIYECDGPFVFEEPEEDEDDEDYEWEEDEDDEEF